MRNALRIASLGILMRCHPFQIVFRPIHDVAVLVIALVTHAINYWSRTMKRSADKTMAGRIAILAHLWIDVAAFAIMTRASWR